MKIFQVTYHFIESIGGRRCNIESTFTSNIFYRADDPEAVKRAARERFQRCFPGDTITRIDAEDIIIEDLT